MKVILVLQVFLTMGIYGCTEVILRDAYTLCAAR